MAWSFIKNFSSLLKDVTSKNVGDFYCLNRFHSYSTKDKPEKHEKVCIGHDYYCVETLKEDNKILQ